MADDISDADRTLLAELRAAVESFDPPPAPLVEAIKNSLDWRDADAGLAELVSDSRLTGAAVRATHPPRVLTFTANEATLVVEVLEHHAVPESTGRRVVGQVVPPAPARAAVRTGDGRTIDVPVDKHGRFRAVDVPDGPLAVSVNYDDPGRPPIRTHWIT